MKKTLLTILIALVISTSVFAGGAKEQAAEEKVYTIGISKLLSHPALDAIAKGIDDYLATTDLKYQIHLENANGDISTCASIAQLFKNEGVDVAVGIATPTAQAISTIMPDVKQVYASVTDPDGAGLTGFDNICGVSDMVPVKAHLELLSSIIPLKKLGMVYTSTEANGIVLMEAMKEACEEKGVELVTVAVNNSAEVRTAALSIVDRVDAMYVSTDNTVISAIQALSDVCMSASKPLFSADITSSYDSSVLISGGFDYYKSGLLNGQLIEKVIKGESPKNIGIQYLNASDLELYINLDAAKQLGLELDEVLVKSATYVVGENK